ncbi:MAG: hypothetical protein R3F59_31530 [Myxococcota bacterium]
MSLQERREVCDTLQALSRELDDLVIRGLRAAGPQDLAALAAMQEELARVGAAHVAERLERLLAGVRGGDPGAPAALMGLQATLRVFERVLSLDTVPEVLAVPEEVPDDDA